MKKKIILFSLILVLLVQIPSYSYYSTVVGVNCNQNVSLSDLGITANDYNQMTAIERTRIDSLIKKLKNTGYLSTLAACKQNVSLADLGITAFDYVKMSAIERDRIDALIKRLKR